MKKVAIITQIWHRAKYYFTSMSNEWYLITVTNMTTITKFFSELSQQILQIYGHNYSNLAWSQILFMYISRPWCLIIVPTMKTNPSSHHGGMCKDRQTDGHVDRQMNRRTDGPGLFLYSLILLMWSGE